MALVAVGPWWGRLSPRVAVCLATLVAAVSCLTGLGRQPLSWDEAVTASAASRPVPDLWQLVRHTDAPLAVYYLAMHGWQAALSLADIQPTEAWLRLPSALAAVAAVALTALLAAELFGPVVGLLAGVLLAVHPLFVFYAHDARPYTLVTACVLLSMLALRGALRNPGLGRLAVYCASCVLIVYVHLFAVFALAAQAVVVGRYGRHRWRFVAVAAVLGVAVAPLVWLAAHQTGEIGWVPRPGPASVASFLARVCGAAVLAAVLLLGLRQARSVRRWWQQRTLGRRVPMGSPGRAELVAWWALLPPIALIAASIVQPVLVARYALVAVPALVIVVALLLSRAGGRGAVAIALAALLVGTATLVYQQTRPFKYEDFRAAADAVTDSARPGDGVLFLPASFRVGYDDYLRPDASDPAAPVAVDLALLSPTRWRADDVIGGRELNPTTLARRVASYPRIFLVGTTLAAALRERHSPAEVAKEQILDTEYHPVWSDRYGDVTVTLLVRGSQYPGAASAG